MRDRLVSILLTPFLLVAVNGLAQEDAAGSADPAAIGARFPGAVIKSQTLRDFDEYLLITGPVRREGEVESGERLEGRISTTDYEIPETHSTLEVLRNYRNKLDELGYETLYTCADQECGGRGFNLTVVPYIQGFGGNERGQRYLAAVRRAPEATTYVSLYVTKNASVGGPTKNRVYARLVLVDVEQMTSELVVVDAREMQRQIADSGSVALYGILFATASADILPESRDTLVEIARLLTQDSQLELLVVGHTDNVGTHDYNMDLSNRRARAVRQTLIEEFGVGAARLSAHGVGFLAPVASNATEDGRARNRRVELVAR